jgi:hypothetical protein
MYRSRKENIGFISNLLKNGKNKEVLILLKVVELSSEEENLDRVFDEAIEELLDDREDLSDYMEYETDD